MKPAFALLFGVALVGCSSDEGYVSVRVAPAPASSVRAIGLGALQLSSDTSTADSSGLVTSGLSDGAVGIVASEIGGAHLWVTVTDVNVKVKGKKHGHGHGHGACNEGDDHGTMHEGDELGMGEHDDGDHEDQNGDDGDHADDDHDGGHHDGDHGGHGHHHGHWTNIFSGQQRVDLFDTSAAGSFLAGGNVPTGMLREIRIVLAGDITLVNGAMSWPVQCPSCSTSGLKIKTRGLNVTDEGELALSVDLHQSLSGDPTTGYVLHPVVHLQSATCADHGGDDGEHDDDGEHGDH